MLADFLYSHPTWLIGLIVIGIWTGLSLLGLIIFHRFVSVELRHKDTETVGLTYAIVAVVYAVLIAFIVVNVFESAAKADEIATAEANQLSNLMLDANGLPPALGDKIRADLNQYIDIVVKKEWPSQQAGKLDEPVFEPMMLDRPSTRQPSALPTKMADRLPQSPSPLLTAMAPVSSTT